MGERTRNIGIDAEGVARNFISQLDYVIEDWNVEDYNIDGITRFSDVQYGLKRPLYSPKGITAFEITSAGLRTKKIKHFACKIRIYNLTHDENPLEGGVIFSSGRVGKKLLDYALERNIYCWDFYRKALYKGKIDTYLKMESSKTFPYETNYDDVSFLTCFNSNVSRKRPLLNFSIFFDTSTRISTAKIRKTMNEIKKTHISPLVVLRYFPLKVNFEFHALSGFSIMVEDLDRLIRDWSNEGIYVTFSETPFVSYNAFPELR